MRVRLLSMLLAALMPLPGQVVLQAPGAFEENMGQVPGETRFVWRGTDDALLFTAESLLWWRAQIRVQFPGANPAVRIAGADPAPGRLNILHGNNPAGWKLNVPRYSGIVYQDLFPGVDLAFRPNPAQSQMLWTATVRPGADLSAFRIRVLNIGSQPQSLPNGVWYTGGKYPAFIISQPRAFQERDGERQWLTLMFRVEADGSLALEPAAYDASRPLTLEGAIGPVPDGYGFTAGALMSADTAGNFHSAGRVVQPDTGSPGQPLCYPPSSSYEQRGSCADIWLGRWSPTGEVRWITILGGECDEYLLQTLVHSSGDIFLTGNTFSADLPVGPNAAQPAYGGARPVLDMPYFAAGDAFLIRLRGDTGELRAATYFGGEESDAAGRMTVDHNGNVYLAGPAPGRLFPTSGAYQPAGGRRASGYALKWDSNANRFGYVALLDAAPSVVAVSNEGELYFASPAVAGLPVTAGAPQPEPLGPADLYFGALSSDGAALGFATYHQPAQRQPGGDAASIWDIAVDAAGRAWVASTARRRYDPLDLSVGLIDPRWGRASTTWIAARVLQARLSVDNSDRVWLVANAGGPALAATPGALQGANCGFSNLLVRFDREPQPSYVSWLPREAEVQVDQSGTPHSFVFMRQFGPSPGLMRMDVTRLHLEPVSEPRLACAVNPALRQQYAAIAPGQLVALVGAGFGPLNTQVARPDAEGRYPLELGGIRVRFNATAAPVLSVSSGEALVQVPYSVAPPQPVTIEIETAVGKRATLDAPSALTSFAFFSADGSGFGQAAALNQDGTVNSPENPARLGSVISLFGTGGGALDLPLEVGRIMNDTARVTSPVIAAVRDAGLELNVEYAGAAPGLPGVNQINLRLPDSLPGWVQADSVGISIYFGTPGRYFILPTPAVTVAVRPADDRP